eukprot:TRINITY_DN1103_c0_g1_i1.p1 TRINITY_DN1103_c0_g1~~TRINITY_DN1103_c0_g1_i1.p1  ORF type:complete len:302 (-),score=57.26 TRINITY_DN1103_c0_g1_i1:117-1022(-)
MVWKVLFNNQEYTFEPVDGDLSTLKAFIVEKLGIPAKQQQFFWEGRILHDDRLPLTQYGIQQNSVIELFQSNEKDEIRVPSTQEVNYNRGGSKFILIKDWEFEQRSSTLVTYTLPEELKEKMADELPGVESTFTPNISSLPKPKPRSDNQEKIVGTIFPPSTKEAEEETRRRNARLAKKQKNLQEESTLCTSSNDSTQAPPMEELKILSCEPTGEVRFFNHISIRFSEHMNALGSGEINAATNHNVTSRGTKRKIDQESVNNSTNSQTTDDVHQSLQNSEMEQDTERPVIIEPHSSSNSVY